MKKMTINNMQKLIESLDFSMFNRTAKVMDAKPDNGWRTTKPENGKGKHYQVDTATGTVVKGYGAGKHVSEAFSKQTNKTEAAATKAKPVNKAESPVPAKTTNKTSEMKQPSETAQTNKTETAQEIVNELSKTTKFQKWFGASKIKSAKTGKPLILHHGSAADIKQFEGGASTYIYFATNESVADGYADSAVDRLAEEGKKGVKRIYDVALRIENPVFLDAKKLNMDYLDHDKYFQDAIKKGHDGAIISNPIVGGEVAKGQFVVPFNANQIKIIKARKIK